MSENELYDFIKDL